MPGPGVCVGGCLRVVTRGMAVGGRLRGASGTPPPTVCPGMGGSGSLPSSRPVGPPSPRGRQEAVAGAAQGLRRASGTPPPTVAREWAVTGAFPSSGLWGHLPPRGRQVAAGGKGVAAVGHPPPTDGDMETPAGFTRTPVPRAAREHGESRACGPGVRRPRQWFGP